MKILLVDDIPTNLKLLDLLLGSQGHAIREAVNGREALETARREPPDLIISDILMPVMDGYSLCRAWMEDAVLARIPFIFYTATYQSDEDEAFALSLGAAAFLRKPMEPDAFLLQVQDVVARTQIGEIRPQDPAPTDEGSFLKLYNERLVQKLDQRSQSLARQVEELQQAEARLRLRSIALDAAANGILIMDRQGVIEWANLAYLEITGFESREILGSRPRFLESGSQGAGGQETMWTTLSSGQVWRGEIQDRHKRGMPRLFQTALSPVRGDGGAVTHFIGILQDVTEQRRIESELLQSQKMEALGRLAGGVAHDFNNMLNVILINSEISLETQALPEPARRRILEIKTAAERSADLTRQLLAFSRKQAAQPRRLDLNEAVEENRKMLKRMIERDIELILHPGPDLRAVFIDPSQVSQMLTNLVVNSRDALPGAGSISIETCNVQVEDSSALIFGGLAPGNYVQLTVSDTGCGMDPFTLRHIFEPFFTTKGEGKGTGLGLSMVYGIIKQNGGAVSVYSNPGLGTSFKIYLPAYDPEDAFTDAAAEESVRGGDETILIAEDEKPMLDVMRLVLEEKGYKVLAASNPLDTVLLASRHEGPIHLLITDVVMPGMNGKELQQRILEARTGFKVLFISGYTGDILAKRGLMREETHFLQKPFRIKALLGKVREVLES
ncbi:response regulator [Geothrix sp. 21YS21S-2]|uniref:response regulator n=1 Tax=Geothrix sp. 21YS21S-2 TaxID=3068893 RepID=UPI0027BAF44F|nr:response regulator [Geothrix sp. 21YS21S-2]